MSPPRPSLVQSPRGSVIAFVAVGIVALTAFSVLVIDFGVMWLARRQAQNAADAGALAAAAHLSFVSGTDQAGAQAAAVAAARSNLVFGVAPTITTADVTFPSCPPGSPGVADTCVRVNVYRNQASGSALPVFFGPVVGVTDQGVRATATAQMVVSGQPKCVKPWAIGDKWKEQLNPAGSYNHYEDHGQNAGLPLGTPNTLDLYCPPTGVPSAAAMAGQECIASADGTLAAGTPTGYVPRPLSQGGDIGSDITLKVGHPQNAIVPGWFYPIVLTCPGGDCYREAIAGCTTTPIGPGTLYEWVDQEPGNMIGPTKQGVEAIEDADPGGAAWDCLSATVPGCESNSAGCTWPDGSSSNMSPRRGAIPVFDPDVFDMGRGTGRGEIVASNIIGIWIKGMRGNDVEACITYPPTLSVRGSSQDPSSAFLRTVILVR